MSAHGGPRSPVIAVPVGIALDLLGQACGQPATLLGEWFLPPAIVVAVEGNSACRLLRLTLTATTYRLTHDPACGGLTSLREVVVNKAEIDFFNADVCGLKFPEGVGRYGWTLNGGVLHFTALNPDPCPPGAAWFDNRSYTRT